MFEKAVANKVYIVINTAKRWFDDFGNLKFKEYLSCSDMGSDLFLPYNIFVIADPSTLNKMRRSLDIDMYVKHVCNINFIPLSHIWSPTHGWIALSIEKGGLNKLDVYSCIFKHKMNALCVRDFNVVLKNATELGLEVDVKIGVNVSRECCMLKCDDNLIEGVVYASHANTKALKMNVLNRAEYIIPLRDHLFGAYSSALAYLGINVTDTEKVEVYKMSIRHTYKLKKKSNRSVTCSTATALASSQKNNFTASLSLTQAALLRDLKGTSQNSAEYSELYAKCAEFCNKDLSQSVEKYLGILK